MARRVQSTSGQPGTGAEAPAPTRKRRTKAEIAADKAREEAKPDEPTQNGVKRPTVGTETRKVWDIADSISATHRRPATRAEVVQEALNQQVNAGTANTHFLNWARFWGLEGAGPATMPAPEPPPLSFHEQAQALAPALYGVSQPPPAFAPPPPVDIVQPPPEVFATRPVPDRAAAWESGYTAYQEGYRRDRCPFQRAAVQAEAWYAGWDAGENDDRSRGVSDA